MFGDDHQNNIDEAMEMYQQMHKWDDAIDVADAKVRMCLDDLVSLTFPSGRSGGCSVTLIYTIDPWCSGFWGPSHNSRINPVEGVHLFKQAFLI